MRRHLQTAFLVVLAACCPALLGSQSKPGARRPIDTTRSFLTVHVYRSGLFAFAGDNHEIRAPISSGSIDEAGAVVELVVQADQMKVLDPGLDAAKRDEVQRKMLGPEVLDVQRYPAITFRSTNVQQNGRDSWSVRGDLDLHGVSRAVVVRVTHTQGEYRGSASLRQTDFGIKPIRVAGGTVKVKDEVTIDFAISTRQ